MLIMRKFYLILFVLMLFMIKASLGATIIINSADWRDVYSGMVYGNLNGESASFLVSDKHGMLILNSIPKGSEVKALSSEDNPYMFGYKSLLESRGYISEEFIYDSFNLELAKLLPTQNFIILDDSYGYNAVSVAPYAAITDSYVLFADEDNINEIDDFLESRDVDQLLIYGHVDRDVTNTLQKYNPEIINKDGDRFDNNIEIIKKYQEIKHGKQAILTNGEFIEKEIMSGVEPVVFIGTNNVPDQIRDYIQDSEIDIGVLIGNELVGTATLIRRQIGISVFVKFAQGARAPQGAISQVEALDMYYLPTYILNIELESIKYNKATNMLEVTIRNLEDQAVYFKGTYSLTDSEGQTQATGDIDPLFLDGNEQKILTYDVELMSEGEINGKVFIIYGESKGSMEKVIDTSFVIETVEVLDECQLSEEMTITYDKRKKSFYIGLENIGEVSCYADVELVDIIIAGERSNQGSVKVIEITPGSTAEARVKAELEEEDIIDNEIVKVRVHYGERKTSLVKVMEGEFELAMKGTNIITYVMIIIIVGLILLIIRTKIRK